jgi:cellobiose-specific phosphotransferase system component IIA
MRDLLYMAAVAGLSLSGLASAIRLIEWLIRTDPRLIAQTGRWAAVGLAVLSAPLLLALLINEKWTAAMALGAVMLLAFSWYGPRLLQRMMRYRVAPDLSSPPAGNVTPTYDDSVGNPDLVRRSIAVLEEYLRRQPALPRQDATYPRAIGAPANMQHSDGAGSASHNGSAHDRSYPPISEAEALDILSLGAEASEVEIKEAHQRLRDLVRAEHGGSQYLAAKIDQAKDLLLCHADQQLRSTASARPSRKHQG